MSTAKKANKKEIQKMADWAAGVIKRNPGMSPRRLSVLVQRKFGVVITDDNQGDDSANTERRAPEDSGG